MNGWIKAVVLGTQRLNEYSQYRGSVRGVTGIKISCFELKEHVTALGKERVVVTDVEGIAEFSNLGFGFYILRCNDDPHTDHLVEVDPRSFSPDVKLVKFEVNL